MNAKQLQMTGVVISLEDMNVIVVEGGQFFIISYFLIMQWFWGPKQQKFFKNLMVSRIKWAEEFIGQKKEKELLEDEESRKKLERNECILVWLISVLILL